ncbi:MAG: BLUF domain-containing protein [Bacteriovoracaceae bacterium]|nr:BLUF domain-containing protein [Bacteriovoracaceae bacterium]
MNHLEKNNLKADITGMLFFGNDYFVQCLEGGRDVVSKLFGKISSDKRHSEFTLQQRNQQEIFDFG